jgi:hypothetical protein
VSQKPQDLPSREKAKHEQDIQDIGRVLACLLGKADADPVQITQQHLTDDLNAFRFSGDPIRVDLGDSGLPPFIIASGYRVHTGGSAIVFQVANPLVTENKFAFKVERPSIWNNMSEAEQESVFAETNAEFLSVRPETLRVI